MRPVLLRLRGFTAFRDEAVVEFGGRRLFVITGPTGAGKSSLLDAMTWALYGRVARGRSNEELVSQGEQEMSVLFEFTVRGQGYRVSRRYPGSTTTRLERLVSGQWVPISDRATEVKREIESILGMNYDTFTRAIVLPQGEFDSFLRGDAKDRRSILSQLIGLNVYERAGVIARERAKEHRTRAEVIRTQLEKMTLHTPETIAGLRQRERELSIAAGALGARRAALGHLGELARTNAERQKDAERTAEAAREAEREVAEAQRALAEAVRRVEAHRLALEQVEARLAALPYDPAEHDRLKAAVALLDQRADAEAGLAQAREELAQAKTARDQTATARDAAETRAAAAARALAAAEKAEHTAEAALAKSAGRALRVVERLTADAEAAERAAAEADRSARDLGDRLRDLASLQQSLATADGDLAKARDAATRAERDRDTRAGEADQASAARERADGTVSEARTVLDAARAEDAAAHLRAGLRVGDPCPVCGEPLTRIGKHAAPNLAKVEKALQRTEDELAKARAAAEAATAAVAAASARVEETSRALAATEALRASLVARLAGYHVDAESLPRYVEESRREGDRLAGAAEERRAEARELGRRAQSLRETLARVPSSIPPDEVKRAPSDPEGAQRDLADALDAHEASRSATREAEREAASAAGKRDSRVQHAEGAERDLSRAERAVEDAEQRVRSLGGVEGDPARVRKDLERAEAAARAQRELSAELAGEREAVASAEASRASAAAAREQSEEKLKRRREECGRAETEAGTARDALAEAWRATLGEGEPSLRSLKAEMEAFETERDAVQRELTTTQNHIEQAEAQLVQAEQMRAEAEEQQGQADLIGSVGRDLQPSKFVAFLLHESMQFLAAHASDRLADFTNGRYALAAEEDTFLVVDHLNGDEVRSVKTLSGGETFLASLALALALSEHLPQISGTGGAVSLDSLFLDEGFGALDSEALDLSVQGLETLAEGSRMIGVISHVDELSERLADRIRVEKGSHGSVVVA